MSSTHKRSFDDMDPELGGRPVGSSRRDSSAGSSSSPGSSRERSKRPRNDSESEVDEILVSSNTSLSSSGSSSSSLDSFQSARSSFVDISPPLLPTDEPSEGELLSLDDPPTLLGPVDAPDAPMDDILSFVSRQDPIPPLDVHSDSQPVDLDAEITRTMERADAFDREIAVLRQSPISISEAVWQPWTPSLPDTSVHGLSLVSICTYHMV